MEASTKPRGAEGEKARRIVEAMRASVARRGAAAATFDHVAQEAGVSRGLLHYYFGSKERLLLEVIRTDCAMRMDRLGESLAEADSIEAIVDGLRECLDEFLAEESESGSYRVIFEMLSEAHHNEEIRREMADVYRTVRDDVAAGLREKERAGVVRLRAEAGTVSAVLFALGDGIALQVIADPSWDSGPAFDTAAAAARFLLGGSE